VTDDHLRVAGIVFAVGSALHVVDHLRRGQGSITETLYVLGNVALVMQVVVVVLILVGHRLAPLAAGPSGVALAIGFFAAHWLPEWGALSDPVWEVESLRWLSYLASAVEILGASAIGVIGIAIVRERGLESFVASP
jgi:hypothetical protein